jgi:hypothetical protein
MTVSVKQKQKKQASERQGNMFGTARERGGTTGVCWESNPVPRKGGTRAHEKDCRSYDLQPVKGKEWILCSRGTRGNAESLKKQVSSSPHFFKII